MSSAIETQSQYLTQDKKSDLPPGIASRWRENRYVPTAPVLCTRAEKTEFLKYLVDCDGWESIAAKKYGVGLRTVQRRKAEDVEFRDAIAAIRASFDQRELEELETISAARAKEKAATTERIFRMNALNPAKYRPKPVAQQPANIHVTFGFDIARYMTKRQTPQARQSPQAVDASYDVVQSDAPRAADAAPRAGLDAIDAIQGVTI